MGPLLFSREASVVALTEEWFQQVIDREVADVELVLVEEAGNRRYKVLRLYIDHPGGVNHDLCAKVSAAVGKALDEVDAFEGAYSLEVSSPGLERPLRKRSHFEAQIGKKVYVKTRQPVEGTKVWQGVLLEVIDDAVVVEEAGRSARIPLEEITNAHLMYEFR
jgi:ribosome maturation factor RimP